MAASSRFILVSLPKKMGTVVLEERAQCVGCNVIE